MGARKSPQLDRIDDHVMLLKRNAVWKGHEEIPVAIIASGTLGPTTEQPDRFWPTSLDDQCYQGSDGRDIQTSSSFGLRFCVGDSHRSVENTTRSRERQVPLGCHRTAVNCRLFSSGSDLAAQNRSRHGATHLGHATGSRARAQSVPPNSVRLSRTAVTPSRRHAIVALWTGMMQPQTAGTTPRTGRESSSARKPRRSKIQRIWLEPRPDLAPGALAEFATAQVPGYRSSGRAHRADSHHARWRPVRLTGFSRGVRDATLPRRRSCSCPRRTY